MELQHFHFPSPETVAQAWGWPKVRLRPFDLGHGAQRLLIDPEGGQWILKHSRAEGVTGAMLRDVLELIAGLGDEIAPAMFPEMRPLAGGGHVLVRDDAFFYLMRRAGGRRPSFRSVEHTRRAVEALAGYHRGAAGAAGALREAAGLEAQQPAAVQWENSRESFEKLERRLDGKGALLGWPASRFVRRHESMRWFYERSGVLAAAAGDLPVTLTHGDTHANNFLIDDGRIWLLDAESYGWRPPVMDLAVPFSYCVRSRGWRPGVFESLLETYEAIRPLCDDERRLLAAWLVFPRQWTRAMLKLVGRGGRFDAGTLRNLAEASWGSRAHRRFAEYALKRWG